MASARNIALTGAVTGNANFDGSGNISITTKQGNIAILTGKLKANGTDADTDIAYPNGFNQNNCVVLSYAIKNASNTSGGYTIGMTNDSASYVRGGMGIAISLRDSKITIRAKNIQVTDEGSINRPIAA